MVMRRGLVLGFVIQKDLVFLSSDGSNVWSSTLPALFVAPVEPGKTHHYMAWPILNVTCQ